MKTITIALTGLAWCIALTACAQTPKGWFPAGTNPQDYEMKLDHTTVHSGKASASLKSIAPQIAGFGTLMQIFKADDYRGKRVRMSGYVRSAAVEDWAGLWLRVDGPKGELLAFDNMQERAVKGTTDWTKYEIVLDVGETAQQIAFGILLSGTGQVWLDDVRFETVGTDVPTTGSKPEDRLPRAPQLDFTK